MRIGIFGGDTAGRTIDDVVAAGATGRGRRLLELLAPPDLRARRDGRARGRRPRGAAHRARDRRRADVRPPPADDGAAGAHRAGRERRALHARHRALAPDGDREHVRAVVRQARCATCASTSRCSCRCCTTARAAFDGETISTSASVGVGAPTFRRRRCWSPRWARRCSSSRARSPTAPSPG